MHAHTKVDSHRSLRPRRPLTWFIVDTAAVSLLTLAWCVSLAGLADTLLWQFDLLAHWRPHYLLGFGALALFWLLRRRRLWFLVALSGCLLHLQAVGPYLWPAPAAAAAEDRPNFSIVTFNTFVLNPQPEAVKGYLQAQDADLVVLLEATPRMAAAVAPAAAEYPFRYAADRNGTRGFLVFSRLPLTFVAQREDGGWAQFMLTHNGQAVDLFVVHTRAPHSAESVTQRNWQLGELGRAVAGAAHPVLLVGDLNTSPWTAAFRDLLAVGGLHDGRRGLALAGTWPSIAGALGTPIDHVLVSEDLRVTALAAGPGSGSDHRPVAATIAPFSP